MKSLSGLGSVPCAWPQDDDDPLLVYVCWYACGGATTTYNQHTEQQRPPVVSSSTQCCCYFDKCCVFLEVSTEVAPSRPGTRHSKVSVKLHDFLVSHMLVVALTSCY